MESQTLLSGNKRQQARTEVQVIMQEWLNAGKACPEKRCRLQPWRQVYSKPNWTQTWASCSGWCSFEQSGWTRRSPEVPSNLSCSVVLWKLGILHITQDKNNTYYVYFILHCLRTFPLNYFIIMWQAASNDFLSQRKKTGAYNFCCLNTHPSLSHSNIFFCIKILNISICKWLSFSFPLTLYAITTEMTKPDQKEMSLFPEWCPLCDSDSLAIKWNSCMLF